MLEVQISKTLQQQQQQKEKIYYSFESNSWSRKPPPSTQELKVYECFTIIGISNLLQGKYLLIATGVQFVAEIQGNEVFRILKGEVVKLFQENGLRNVEDEYFITLLEWVISSGSLYYSYTYNLTKSIQQQNQGGEFLKPLTWKNIQENYCWNHFLSLELNDIGLGEFCAPIICGFVSQQIVSIKNEIYKIILISRRHKNRAGLRYTTRGLDKKGNAANFVESEQIISKEKMITSFVQTRGSIPILWKQIVDMSYRPRLQIQSLNSDNLGPTKSHIEDQISTYGEQLFLNLISWRGFEGTLRLAFKETMDNVHPQNVKYEEFFFNRECKKMNYKNVTKLLNSIHSDISRHSFFALNGSRVISQQVGVIRTNCLDCLDRTNLVQTLISLELLKKQFEFLGIENIDELSNEIAKYRYIWADNGDQLSLQYAGTPALKGNFTRTGKFSLVKDGLKDALSSMTRYYLNNFVDGLRQDALDLFVFGKIGRKQTILFGLIEINGDLQLSKIGTFLGFGLVGRCISFVTNLIFSPFRMMIKTFSPKRVKEIEKKKERKKEVSWKETVYSVIKIGWVVFIVFTGVIFSKIVPRKIREWVVTSPSTTSNSLQNDKTSKME